MVTKFINKNKNFIILENIDNFNDDNIISIIKSCLKININEFNIKILNNKLKINNFFKNIFYLENKKQIIILNGSFFTIALQNTLINFNNELYEKIYFIIFINDISKILNPLQKNNHIIKYENNIDIITKKNIAEILNQINDKNKISTLNLLNKLIINKNINIFKKNIIFLLEGIIEDIYEDSYLKNIDITVKIKICRILNAILYNLNRYNICSENIILNLTIQIFNII